MRPRETPQLGWHPNKLQAYSVNSTSNRWEGCTVNRLWSKQQKCAQVCFHIKPIFSRVPSRLKVELLSPHLPSLSPEKTHPISKSCKWFRKRFNERLNEDSLRTLQLGSGLCQPGPRPWGSLPGLGMITVKSRGPSLPTLRTLLPSLMWLLCLPGAASLFSAWPPPTVPRSLQGRAAPSAPSSSFLLPPQSHCYHRQLSSY